MIGPAGAQAVPEELLAIEGVVRSVDERRPEGHQRQPALQVHAEEQPLGGGLIAHVGIGVVIRRQRIALFVVEPVAIGRYARKENVALQAVCRTARTVASTCAAVVPRSQS